MKEDKLDLKTLIHLKNVTELFSDNSNKSFIYNYICQMIINLELEKIDNESTRNK